MTAKPGAGAAGKADALNRGRQARSPGAPSAQPLPVPLPDMPADPSPSPATSSGRPARTAGRAPDGHGRRGHLRKLTVEMTPNEHDRLKMWLITAFSGDTKATPVIKALLAEAYTDPALTDRIRRRLA